MSKINAIDIGKLYNLRENFCTGLPAEEHVEGKYRDLTKLLLRLAEFYLKANKHRVDKLIWFNNHVGHFKVAIGGDGAPCGKDDCVLAWLVSFLNCGQRISSRDENYLFLGQIVLKIVKLLGALLLSYHKTSQKLNRKHFRFLLMMKCAMCHFLSKCFQMT